MRILVSNDDGVFAAGIQALAAALVAAGHEVSVVCPDRERSATGHGLTLHDPIRVDEVHGIFAPGVLAWACSGTPADCVKLGLGALLDGPPDLVCAGINHGSNLGNDVLYSGTVSAAMEGAMEGIPAIAFSLSSYTSRDFAVAAEVAASLVDQVLAAPMPVGTLLNVNIPAVGRSEITGAKLCRQGIRRYEDQFERRLDPKGRTYFWLMGEALEEVDLYNPTRPDLPPTDVQMIREGFVTIVPLQFDLTRMDVVGGEGLPNFAL
jgi:5'-nucleotidase